MPFSAYLTIQGKIQGKISGSVTQKGRKNSILIHSFDNEILSPRDSASGLATGKRQHHPIVILKEIDKSSPRLWTALITNEVLTSWELDIWGPSATAPGTEAKIYTISLTNASIGSIHEFMAEDDLPANLGRPLQEEITFTYQKIKWTWVDGGITATDDWAVT